MWQLANAQALPLPSGIAVGVSPFLYQFLYAGSGSVIVQGAGVTLVEFTRDQGTTWYPIGMAAGMYAVSQGDYLRITYGAAPVMTLVLR
jgi:hypothetical protein